MNFFEHQRKAKRETRTLCFHFLFAVIAIVFLTNVAIILTIELSMDYSSTMGSSVDREALIYVITFCTLSLVLGGMIFKVFQLMAGGKVVANMLGGFPIEKSTKDLGQKTIVNIVDEMSLASGIPSPPIYILEGEMSINAFVAGFDIERAVIAVTEGAVYQLNRSELQAVVAHEFSHLFNGDMKLNTYLIAVLHGIQMISSLGSRMLSMRRRRSTFSSSRRRSSKGEVQILILGAVLYGLGYVGLFFARMIKNEINEQREFLADATAVQFTRDGYSLTNVFKKILANEKNQYLVCGQAEVVGHMCITSADTNQNKTHPDLVERIKRIDKSFDKGDFFRNEIKSLQKKILDVQKEKKPLHPKVQKSISDELGIDAIKDINQALLLGAGLLVGNELLKGSKSKMGKVKSSLGEHNDESLGYAKSLITSIPLEVREIIHDKNVAKAVLYSLFLNISKGSIEIVKDERAEVKKAMVLVSMKLESFNRQFHLPLIDLTLGTLRELNKVERVHILKTLRNIIKDDKKINIVEFLYYSIVSKYLNDKKRSGLNNRNLLMLKKEVSYAVSILAHTGFLDDTEAAQLALNKVATSLGYNVVLAPLNSFSISEVNIYMKKLNRLNPEDKKVFLETCIDLINFDSRVLPMEIEVIRAFAALLDTPLPQVILK